MSLSINQSLDKHGKAKNRWPVSANIRLLQNESGN